MQKLIFNNSSYKEEKYVIKKLNQVIVIFLNTWKNSDTNYSD
jgi:hypothetical protein